MLAGYIPAIDAITCPRPEEVLTTIGYNWHHNHPHSTFSRQDGEDFMAESIRTVSNHFSTWNAQRKRTFAEQLIAYLELTFTETACPSTEEMVRRLQ